MSEEIGSKEDNEFAHDGSREIDLSGKVLESVKGDSIRIIQSSAKTIEGKSVTIEQGGVGQIRADQVTLHEGGIGMVDADIVAVTNGGVGLVRANEASIIGGGVLGAVSQSVTVKDAQAGLVIAQEIRNGPVKSVVLLAQNVEGPVETVLDTPQAILAGLVSGVAIGLVLTIFNLLIGRRK